MRENKALRFWKWAVILLVLCNVALVSVIWFRPHLPFGPKPEQPRDFVIRKLDFTPDQVKKYDALIQEHQKYMQQFRHEAADARMQLFDHLKTGEDADGKVTTQYNSNPFVDSLTNLIGFKQRQIEATTYWHFAQVRKLCTDRQKAEFDKIIGEVTKLMSGQSHGNRPPGDHQGPPPPDGPPHHDPGPPENE